MEKMKKLKICIASGLAFVSMLGGVFVGAKQTVAEDAGDASKVQTASSLWENVNGITLENNVDVPDYMKYGKYSTVFKSSDHIHQATEEKQDLQPWELNGMKMTSELDDMSISYKNTLDLTGFTTADEFLTVAPIPMVQSAHDYTEVEFLLQDADDEDNYLKITLTHYILWPAGTTVTAETSNVSARGHNIYIGAFKGLTRDLDTNFMGNTEISEFRHRPIKLRYDEKKKLVSIVAQAGEVSTIVDLDDEHSVGYGNKWKGFKNNRVKLTVTMRGFVAQEAQLMILNVCGQGMNGATLEDTTAPKFSFEEAANVTPKAQIGKKYALYNAHCLDVVSGQMDYSCTVVSPSGKDVKIVDGGFTPTEGGYYTLTYTATDLAGNEAKETFKVFATNALSPITIDVAAAAGSFSAGENIPVYEATAQGGSGMLNVTTEVVRIGGGERVTVEEGEFKPMLGGTYCVIYTATDYLGNKATKTISYEVAQSQSVDLESITELKRLFDGVQVRFPEPIAYDYITCVGNKLNAKYEISVYDKEGAKEVLTDGIFTPDREKYGKIVKVEYVVYAANDPTKANAVKYTYNVPLFSREIDEDTTGQIEDYFVFDKNVFTTSYNLDSKSGFLKFYTDQAAEAQSISFANPLLAEGFYISFVRPAGEQNYDSLTISLRDSVNSQIGIDLELIDMTTELDAKTMTYVRSGGVNYAMNGTGNKFQNVKNPDYVKDVSDPEDEFLKDPETGEYIIEEVSSKTPLELTYKDGKIIDYTGHVVLRPTVGFNGKEFNGFPSGKAYATITFNNVTGASSLKISQLSTQVLRRKYEKDGSILPFTDVSKPQIVLSEDVRSDYILNDVVEVPSAMGFDVITPNVDVYVTVKTPSGRVIYDKVLATEALYFVLDSQGKYTITYEAEDADNGTRKVYTIQANDVTAPTIAVSVTELNARVNQEITLPNAVLLDDMDQNPRLCIMIITPSATIITLGEPTEQEPINSYTFTEKGTYYIRYCAFDSTYNMGITDIPVIVS